jgi:hypothetical protein
MIATPGRMHVATRLPRSALGLAVLFKPYCSLARGSAGIAALLCLYFIIPHPRRALALVATAALSLLILAYALPGIGGRFDGVWLALVKDRSPYLFLAHWTLDDWSRVGVTLSTLIVGALTLPGGRMRSLCRATLMTTIGGLGLTLIACDLLHLVLLTQLQPWRWQWLGTVAGALMLPPILGLRWRSGTAGRATAGLELSSQQLLGVCRLAAFESS